MLLRPPVMLNHVLVCVACCTILLCGCVLLCAACPHDVPLATFLPSDSTARYAPTAADTHTRDCNPKMPPHLLQSLVVPARCTVYNSTGTIEWNGSGQAGGPNDAAPWMPDMRSLRTSSFDTNVSPRRGGRPRWMGSKKVPQGLVITNMPRVSASTAVLHISKREYERKETALLLQDLEAAAPTLQQGHGLRFSSKLSAKARSELHQAAHMLGLGHGSLSTSHSSGGARQLVVWRTDATDGAAANQRRTDGMEDDSAGSPGVYMPDGLVITNMPRKHGTTFSSVQCRRKETAFLLQDLEAAAPTLQQGHGLRFSSKTSAKARSELHQAAHMLGLGHGSFSTSHSTGGARQLVVWRTDATDGGATN